MSFYLPISYYWTSGRTRTTHTDIVRAENVFVRWFVIPREAGLIDVTVENILGSVVIEAAFYKRTDDRTQLQFQWKTQRRIFNTHVAMELHYVFIPLLLSSYHPRLWSPCYLKIYFSIHAFSHPTTDIFRTENQKTEVRAEGKVRIFAVQCALNNYVAYFVNEFQNFGVETFEGWQKIIELPVR